MAVERLRGPDHRAMRTAADMGFEIPRNGLYEQDHKIKVSGSLLELKVSEPVYLAVIVCCGLIIFLRRAMP